MMVREYHERDLEALKAIHQRQGIDYPFPDLSNPLYFSKLVLEKDGEPAAALLARLTCEMFLLMGPGFGTPAERWEGFLRLHASSEVDVYEKGLDDAHAWLPPDMVRFGRRLESIGWRRQLWPVYCKILMEDKNNGTGKLGTTATG